VWMRGFEMLWIVFLILVAEIARYWKPLRARASHAARGPGSGGTKPGSPRAGRPGPSRGTRRPAASNAWFHSVSGNEPAGNSSWMLPTAGMSEAPAATMQAARTSQSIPTSLAEAPD